jgi:hypothetical protein
MKRVVLVLILGVSLLTACTPTASQKKVEVKQLNEAISYYPHEVGASWTYLEAGETLDAFPVVTQVEGPTIIDGDLWIATHQAGRGLDVVWYRQYRPDGVFLLKEVRPGMELSYDPPLQEMPAEDTLRVGSNWTGQTTVTIFYPDAKPNQQYQTYTFDYTYTVVDQRPANVQAGDFEVYVLNLVAVVTDAEGNEQAKAKQELWFTPFVGEVLTENGYVLVDTNVN